MVVVSVSGVTGDELCHAVALGDFPIGLFPASSRIATYEWTAASPRPTVEILLASLARLGLH